MTKRKKPSKKSADRNPLDNEAIGLLLFGITGLLGLSLFAPEQAIGTFGQSLGGFLTGQFAMGAYVLPLLPAVYGYWVFRNIPLKKYHHAMRGAVVIWLGILLLMAVVIAGSGGSFIEPFAEFLRTYFRWLAIIPALIVISMGVELWSKRPSLSLLKGFSAMVVVAVYALLHRTKEGQFTLRLGAELRGILKELHIVQSLYPTVSELRSWATGLQKAQSRLTSLDLQKKQELSEEISAIRQKLQEFCSERAKETQELLLREDYPAPETPAFLLQQQAHTLRSTAWLENYRKEQVHEWQTLQKSIAQLQQEALSEQKSLSGNPKPQQLEAVLSKQKTRIDTYHNLQNHIISQQGKMAQLEPWLLFISEIERHPNGSVLDTDLADALERNPEKTLRELKMWQRSLNNLPEAVPLFEPPAIAEEKPQQVPTPPNLSVDPIAPQTQQEQYQQPYHDVEWDFADLDAPASPKVQPETHNSTPQQPVATPAKPEKKPKTHNKAKTASLPTALLLDPVPKSTQDRRILDQMARERADLINQTLGEFKVQAKVIDFARGPTVTRYEIEPAPGEKISRISGLSNDLARAMAVGGVRIEAPVPGKSVIGLEVPNAEREPVFFNAALQVSGAKTASQKLPIVLGKSIDGEMVVEDLTRMPHVLIAGSTGSGKSVCVNTLIISLLYKFLPKDLRFLMVDPKMVELTPYDGIPHLIRPVVTNPNDAAGVLLGAVSHMERRYKMMSQVGAKNLEQFNAKMKLVGEPEMPYIVIIIDELADLMITSPKEVESAIMRLAQMARATGMHLVLATQRPSVDILTSLIKVNVPARVAFAVSSGHDSRTILDNMGAERLTGMGDMLFYKPGLIKPVRLQGPFINENEIQRITEFLQEQPFDDAFGEAYGTDFDTPEDKSPSAKAAGMDFSDPLLRQAAEICIEEGQGSVSRLQRRLSVGHARAGKLMDLLEAMGIVSKHQGSKPREVLINSEDLPEYFGR